MRQGHGRLGLWNPAKRCGAGQHVRSGSPHRVGYRIAFGQRQRKERGQLRRRDRLAASVLSLVSDLSREADFMGAFALLLILPKGRVDPAKFRQWRNRFHEVWEDVEPTDDETEQEFEEKYNGYLELAFQCGVDRFSSP
jgi:hypothetical protein